MGVKHMTKNTDIAVINVDEKQIPAIVQEQFGELRRYKSSVDLSIKKAGTALKSAKNAKRMSARLGHKKAAIESLQDAVVDNADALGSFADAQEVSFEYQQKLGEICKYLFGMGVSNIAANRSVIRELEMKLSGASQEELDELARQEIYGVIRQLKAQEDIMQKQNFLTDEVRKHDKRLDESDKKDKVQDEEIARQASKDEEHDMRLDEGDKKDKVQDEEIARQASKDEEHDMRLDEGEKKDKAQDEELSRQALKNEEHDSKIKKLEQKIEVLEKKYEQLNKQIKAFDLAHINNETELRSAIDSRFTRNASIISAVVGATGLIVAILGFFF